MRLSEKLLQNDNVYIDNATNLVIEQDNFDFNDDVSYYAYIEPDVIELGDGTVLVSNEVQGDILIVNSKGIESLQVLDSIELEEVKKKVRN